MANWTTLKAAIADVIKTNGNQEITGPILQSALNSIISTIGENATFAGVAAPTTSPGIPDGPVFYLATEQGTYSNFGGVSINSSGLYIIYSANNEWLITDNLVSSLDNALKGVGVSAYSYAFRYVGNLVDEDSVKAKDKLVRLLNSYCTTADDRTLSELLAIYKSGASELLPYTGTLRGQVNGVPFTVRQNTSSWGKFYTQTFIGPFVFSGDSFNTASGVEHTWVRSIDTSGTKVNYGDWYEPKSGELTLAQLDNPFGFATVAQWTQGLRGEQSYTFRLVEPTGRCIGHVWLFNDADNPSNSNSAARTLEVVMCCATISAETGRLNYDAINGSPRIYYRSYCVPLTGGTPDGGLPVGNKWSLWQEYREYVTKPIQNALAALQQQHASDVAALQQQHASDVAALQQQHRTDVSALQQQHRTDVSELQAKIDATVAAIPGGVLNLGMKADADTILSEAAKYAVVSDPFKAVITAQYMVGTAVQSIVIHQQVTKNSDGSGVCMQYVYKDKARFTRYINFNAAARVTAVQPLQPDGVRNLYYTDTGFIGQRDMWSTQVGSGFFLPNKNDLREGTPTATTVPLVLTKAIKDTATCNLGAATTARAGVMTVEQVEQLADAKSKADKEAGRHYTFDTIYTSLDDFLNTTFEESPEVWVDEDIEYVHSQVLVDGVESPLTVHKSTEIQNEPDTSQSIVVRCFIYLKGYILYVDPAYVKNTTGILSYNDYGSLDDLVPRWMEVTALNDFVSIDLKGGFIGTILSSIEVRAATTSKAGVMTAAHVQKLANLEARIAALESK